MIIEAVCLLFLTLSVVAGLIYTCCSEEGPSFAVIGMFSIGVWEVYKVIWTTAKPLINLILQ